MEQNFKLRETNRSTVAQDDKVDLQIHLDRYKEMEGAELQQYCSGLSSKINVLSKLVNGRLSSVATQGDEFDNFLKRIKGTLDAIMLKDRITSMKKEDVAKVKCDISTVDSGFPVYFTNINFLMQDRENGEAVYAKLPTDEKIVDDLLYYSSRGLDTNNVIYVKLTRNYYTLLRDSSLVDRVRIFPEELIEKKKTKNSSQEDFKFFRKFVERFDDSMNIPRFYAIYFRVPSGISDSPKWREELNAVIPQGFSTMPSMELPCVAPIIEDINGVILEKIERYDVGPYYSKHTQNKDGIKKLIDAHQNEGILMFQKLAIQRMGEQEKKGFMTSIKCAISGDKFRGVFSPVIATPQYLLMSHQLIQKVYSQNLFLGDNIKMYGINQGGDLVD
jgi:hypothetical protein